MHGNEVLQTDRQTDKQTDKPDCFALVFMHKEFSCRYLTFHNTQVASKGFSIQYD